MTKSSRFRGRTGALLVLASAVLTGCSTGPPTVTASRPSAAPASARPTGEPAAPRTEPSAEPSAEPAAAAPAQTPTPTPTASQPATATPSAVVATPTLGPPSGPLALPAPGARARVVSRGRTDRALVALTFDAGADVGSTARILDVLAGERVPATFGVTGRWVEANPALARRIAADGHQVVNHTYDHRSFTGVSSHAGPLSRAQRGEEVVRAEETISRVIGTSTAGWFRPPYGDRDLSVDADVGSAGYPVELMWSVDSLGWAGHSVDDIVSRVLAAAGPGQIALFHVGAASADAAALPRVIAGLRARGLGFGTAAQVVLG